MSGVEPDGIMKDLAVLVNGGLDRGYARLTTLPGLQATRLRLRSTTVGGLRAAVRLLIEDAIGEMRSTSSEYAAAARELLQLGPKTLAEHVSKTFRRRCDVDDQRVGKGLIRFERFGGRARPVDAWRSAIPQASRTHSQARTILQLTPTD